MSTHCQVCLDAKMDASEGKCWCCECRKEFNTKEADRQRVERILWNKRRTNEAQS